MYGTNLELHSSAGMDKDIKAALEPNTNVNTMHALAEFVSFV